MKADFYIYLHSTVDGSVPFYVGKGRLRRAYSKHGRSTFWNSIVSKHGFKVDIISANLNEGDAFLHEKRFIAFYGKRTLGLGPLINLADGGEGVSGHTNQNWRYRVETEESRRKKSESHKGKKRPEHSLLMKSRPRNKGLCSRPVGFNQSELTKQKLRDANLGKKATPEIRQKMSQGQYRRWANHRAKTSI